MKKALGMILAAAMTLSVFAGCSEKAKAVAKVNDIEVTSDEVRSLMNYYFQQSGFELPAEPTEDEQKAADEMRDNAIDDLIYEKVHLVKAKEDGLDQFTEEEDKALDEDVKAFLDNAYQSVSDNVTQTSELTGPELADEIKKTYEDLLDENGYTEEYLKERFKISDTLDRVYEKYADTIEPGEEDIKTQYDNRIEEEKSYFESSPGAYTYMTSMGMELIHRPTGLRKVSHILIGISEEDEAAIQALEDLEKYEEAEAMLEECVLALKPAADEVYALLQEEGADYSAIQKEYSDDKGEDGSVNEPEGYIVEDGSMTLVTEYVEGGMALAKVGDISEPIKSQFGYHILRLEEELEEYDTPVGELGEELVGELKSYAQNELYEKLVEEWKKEMTIERYPENVVYPTPAPTPTPDPSDDASESPTESAAPPATGEVTPSASPTEDESPSASPTE